MRDSKPTPSNPIIPANCPDPAVITLEEAGERVHYLTCTSNINDDGPKYPIYRSKDLQHWEQVGHIFPVGGWPSWARRDFWAPEIHALRDRFVVYFTARDASNTLCVGAAFAQDICGPWTDIGRPFLEEPPVGRRRARCRPVIVRLRPALVGRPASGRIAHSTSRAQTVARFRRRSSPTRRDHG